MANQRHTQTGAVVVYDVPDHIKITEEQIALSRDSAQISVTQEQAALARGAGALQFTEERLAVTRTSGSVFFTSEGILLVRDFHPPKPRTEVLFHG